MRGSKPRLRPGSELRYLIIKEKLATISGILAQSARDISISGPLYEIANNPQYFTTAQGDAATRAVQQLRDGNCPREKVASTEPSAAAGIIRAMTNATVP